jgi:hypothetical protein
MSVPICSIFYNFITYFTVFVNNPRHIIFYYNILFLIHFKKVYKTDTKRIQNGYTDKNGYICINFVIPKVVNIIKKRIQTDTKRIHQNIYIYFFFSSKKGFKKRPKKRLLEIKS